MPWILNETVFVNYRNDSLDSIFLTLDSFCDRLIASLLNQLNIYTSFFTAEFIYLQLNYYCTSFRISRRVLVSKTQFRIYFAKRAETFYTVSPVDVLFIQCSQENLIYVVWTI